MNQPEKLIGGWVAGTLTPAERKLLLDASMRDQALFDALADEEGLREIMADPRAKRDLLAALGPAPAAAESWWRRLFKPAPMAAFSAGVLAVVTFVAVRPMWKANSEAVEVAKPQPMASVSAPPARPLADAEAPKKDQGAESDAKSRRPADQPVAALEKAKPYAAPPEPAPLPAAPAVMAPPPTVEMARGGAAAPPLPSVAAAPPALAREEAKASAKVVAAPAPAPIRFRIERYQAASNTWVEFGGDLSVGDRARLAITAQSAGRVFIADAGSQTAVDMESGQTLLYPASGSFASEAGERAVAVRFRPGQAVAGSGLGGAVSALGGFRAGRLKSEQPPAQQQQQRQQVPGGGVRERADQEARATQDANSTAVSADAVPLDFGVTVRLRFR